MEEEQYPLVTFALFSYNQENYIREALEGALAQNYPNLEIIISDDCSLDGTWTVIKKMVAEYSGPHKIILNKNEKNLGISGHVNLIASMSKGELIVVAAGDDISLAERATTIVESWLRAGRPISAIHSTACVIDENGNPSGNFVKGKASDPAEASFIAFVNANFSARIIGATAAYTPEQFRLFEPLIGNIEDVPLTLRTLLLGELIFIEKPLVKYRVSSESISRKLTRSDRVHVGFWIEACILNIKCLRRDYEIFCRTNNCMAERHVVGKLNNLERLYIRSMGMASSNMLMNIHGLFYFPNSGTFRDRLWIIAAYFGLKK